MNYWFIGIVTIIISGIIFVIRDIKKEAKKNSIKGIYGYVSGRFTGTII